MSLNFEDVKLIQQNHKDIVFGYIRGAQQLLPSNNPYYNISTLVSHTILLFYVINEYFFKYGRHVEVTDDRLTIKHIMGGYDTIYGSQRIESNESAIHKWRVKIITCCSVNLYVGIDSSECKWINKPVMWQTKSINYSFKANGWKYCSDVFKSYSSVRIKDGDVIEMILDLSKSHLKFIINDTDDLGVAYNVIKNNQTKYRLTI